MSWKGCEMETDDVVLYKIRIWDPAEDDAPMGTSFEHLTFEEIPDIVERWQEEHGEYFAMEMRVEEDAVQGR